MFNWKKSKNYEENFSDAQYRPLDDEESEIEILYEMECGELPSGHDL